MILAYREGPFLEVVQDHVSSQLSIRVPWIIFKAVKSAEESPSTFRQPIADLLQTGYNEFRLKYIPDITFLEEFSKAVKMLRKSFSYNI